MATSLLLKRFVFTFPCSGHFINSSFSFPVSLTLNMNMETALSRASLIDMLIYFSDLDTTMHALGLRSIVSYSFSLALRCIYLNFLVLSSLPAINTRSSANTKTEKVIGYNFQCPSSFTLVLLLHS